MSKKRSTKSKSRTKSTGSNSKGKVPTVREALVDHVMTGRPLIGRRVRVTAPISRPKAILTVSKFEHVAGAITFHLVLDSDKADGGHYVKAVPNVIGRYDHDCDDWYCTCADFFFRRLGAESHCCHIDIVRGFVHSIGGYDQTKRGYSIKV